MQTPLPRRTVLATAVAAMASSCAPLPAVASPAPDAELAKLGVAFDRAAATFLRVATEGNQAHEAWRASVQTRNLTFAANYAEVTRLYSEMGCQAADADNEVAMSNLDSLAERICAIRPVTLIGLAVHGKVARFYGTTSEQRETPPDDRDWAAHAILRFLDVVEGLAS